MNIPSIATHVQWRATVTEENGSAYEFPQRFTSYFREKYSRPAVYRWWIHPVAEAGKLEDVYIGEAEDLVSRIQRVLTPSKSAKGGETNKRLNKIFSEAKEAGRHVNLAVADFPPFEMDGVLFSVEKLSDPFRRAVLENVWLILAQQEGRPVINKTVDLAEKQFIKYFKKLPAHKKNEFIESYRIKKQKGQL